MSKAFFRFLRGEINGFYLNSIHNVFNKYTENIKAFFSSFHKQQFTEGKIDDKYLYGLGLFAGVVLPKLQKEDSITSLRMTDSFKVSGIEFSERGLFNTESEQFQFYNLNDTTSAVFVFVRTNQDGYGTDINTESNSFSRSSLVGNETPLGYISAMETDLFDSYGNIKKDKILATPPSDSPYVEYYGDNFLFLSEGDDSEADRIIRLRLSESEIVNGIQYSERGLFLIPISTMADINTFATDTMRSSLVGNEKPIGYISSLETEVLDDNGKVRPEKILNEPPTDVAYSEFYGNQFLFLSENKVSYENLDPSLYFALFKTMQYIKYNGTSIDSLVKIIDVLCPKGLVKISNISVAEGIHAFILFYIFDITAEVDLKQQRLYLFRYIVAVKFPQLILTEI